MTEESPEYNGPRTVTCHRSRGNEPTRNPLDNLERPEDFDATHDRPGRTNQHTDATNQNSTIIEAISNHLVRISILCTTIQPWVIAMVLWYMVLVAISNYRMSRLSGGGQSSFCLYIKMSRNNLYSSSSFSGENV